MAMICFLNGFLNTSELNKSKNGAKARIQKWFYAPQLSIKCVFPSRLSQM